MLVKYFLKPMDETSVVTHSAARHDEGTRQQDLEETKYTFHTTGAPIQWITQVIKL